MSRPKKDPFITKITRPDHLFDEAYPYQEGAIKQYAVLLLYQEKVNTRQLDQFDPAQIRAHALYYEEKDEAYDVYDQAIQQHGSRLFYGEIFYLKLGINGAFWESLIKTGRISQ